MKLSIQLRTNIGDPILYRKIMGDPFTKTGAGGTGLGLAICREIVEAHQGIIWAENNAEGGAAFVVLLPINP